MKIGDLVEHVVGNGRVRGVVVGMCDTEFGTSVELKLEAGSGLALWADAADVGVIDGRMAEIVGNFHYGEEPREWLYLVPTCDVCKHPICPCCEVSCDEGGAEECPCEGACVVSGPPLELVGPVYGCDEPKWREDQLYGFDDAVATLERAQETLKQSTASAVQSLTPREQEILQSRVATGAK